MPTFQQRTRRSPSAAGRCRGRPRRAAHSRTSRASRGLFNAVGHEQRRQDLSRGSSAAPSRSSRCNATSGRPRALYDSLAATVPDSVEAQRAQRRPLAPGEHGAARARCCSRARVARSNRGEEWCTSCRTTRRLAPLHRRVGPRRGGGGARAHQAAARAEARAPREHLRRVRTRTGTGSCPGASSARRCGGSASILFRRRLSCGSSSASTRMAEGSIDAAELAAPRPLGSVEPRIIVASRRARSSSRATARPRRRWRSSACCSRRRRAGRRRC